MLSCITIMISAFSKASSSFSRALYVLMHWTCGASKRRGKIRMVYKKVTINLCTPDPEVEGDKTLPKHWWVEQWKGDYRSSTQPGVKVGKTTDRTCHWGKAHEYLYLQKGKYSALKSFWFVLPCSDSQLLQMAHPNCCNSRSVSPGHSRRSSSPRGGAKAEIHLSFSLLENITR